MEPQTHTTKELLDWYRQVSAESFPAFDATLYLREMERRQDNMCRGLIALAKLPPMLRPDSSESA